MYLKFKTQNQFTARQIIFLQIRKKYMRNNFPRENLYFYTAQQLKTKWAWIGRRGDEYVARGSALSSTAAVVTIVDAATHRRFCQVSLFSLRLLHAYKHTHVYYWRNTVWSVPLWRDHVTVCNQHIVRRVHHKQPRSLTANWHPMHNWYWINEWSDGVCRRKRQRSTSKSAIQNDGDNWWPPILWREWR